MSALKHLILRKIKKKSMSRAELARAIGYTNNVSRGLRRLDSLLVTANGSVEFINKLLKILEISHKAYNEAVTRDAFVKENRERESFKPFLEIMIERGGMPIIPYGIILSLGIVPIDENLKSLSTEEEITAVISITNHLIENSNILSGVSRKGFRYHRTYDECWVFSNDGQIIEKKFRNISPITVELKIGNKKVSISKFFGDVQIEGEGNE